MNAVLKVCALGLGQLVAIGMLVFVPAGTLNYWQAWTFLAVFAIAAWIPSIYLQLTNPVVLQRRMRSGPIAEGRTVQKLVMLGLYGSLAAICVVSGLDRRFGWSSVPPALCVIGSLLAGAGLGVAVLVASRIRMRRRPCRWRPTRKWSAPVSMGWCGTPCTPATS